MSLSIIICEGPLDRVVLTRLLEKVHRWQPTPDKEIPAAQQFLREKPFMNRALLRATDDTDAWLAILERSKSKQADAVKTMVAFNLQSPAERRWHRLLVVGDADCLGISADDPDVANKVAAASRDRVRGWFSYAKIPLTNQDPLQGWQETELPLSGSIPPEKVPVAVCAHILPAVGQPGCLETALLVALSAQGDERLVEHLRSSMEIARGFKDDYLKGVSALEKATIGAVLSALMPDRAYETLKDQYGAVAWEQQLELLRALPFLRQLKERLLSA